MHPDWARSLRDQCQAAGVAFHFKQYGEYVPAELAPECHDLSVILSDGRHLLAGNSMDSPDVNGEIVARVGKKAAGRLLDGRTWDQFPEPR